MILPPGLGILKLPFQMMQKYRQKPIVPKPPKDLLRDLMDIAKAEGIDLQDKKAVQEFATKNAYLKTSPIFGAPGKYQLKKQNPLT